MSCTRCNQPDHICRCDKQTADMFAVVNYDDFQPGRTIHELRKSTRKTKARNWLKQLREALSD